ncbi:uncharacterized protein LOC134681464 [Mytilus trossulus]|uniref:uncharacterized protein LOC134681464 n=1 Tax=Mytilus trossulus TaxID=6551 RepID=UPI00300523FC
MASSRGKLCGSCEVRHMTEVSIVWCTTCDEGLCITCLEHHKANKASRKHETIPINQYTSIESLSSSIKQECEKHDQKISFYCLDHDDIACGLCIPEHHRQCTGLKSIDELACHAKTSVDLLDTKRGFEELGKTLKELKYSTKQNIDTIQGDKKTISTEIMSLRKRLNKHLDEMEVVILKDLDTNTSRNLSVRDQLMSKLKEKEESIEQIGTKISHVTEVLSDVQVFLVTKYFRGKLCEEENWVSGISQLDAAQEINLKLKINPNLEQTLTNQSSYGEIQTIQTPCQIMVGAWEQKRAQIRAPIATKRDIEQTQLKLTRNIQLKEGSYQDCIIVPDGRMIFASFGQCKLSVYKKDGMFSKDIDVGLRQCLNGLALINNNTVAVSCSNNKSINIVNIDTGIVKQKINVDDQCFGLSYYNKKLYILVIDEGIYELDLDGHLLRTIRIKDYRWGGYLSIHNDKFIYTNGGFPNQHFIACCDLSGKEIWRSHVSYSGVTVDQFGNCFVANDSLNTITIISTDGKRTNLVLSRNDSVENPRGVSFDKSDNTLLVVCEKGMAALYRVI